jgi:hypothetical protein
LKAPPGRSKLTNDPIDVPGRGGCGAARTALGVTQRVLIKFEMKKITLALVLALAWLPCAPRAADSSSAASSGTALHRTTAAANAFLGLLDDAQKKRVLFQFDDDK